MLVWMYKQQNHDPEQHIQTDNDEILQKHFSMELRIYVIQD